MQQVDESQSYKVKLWANHIAVTIHKSLAHLELNISSAVTVESCTQESGQKLLALFECNTLRAWIR